MVDGFVIGSLRYCFELILTQSKTPTLLTAATKPVRSCAVVVDMVVRC